MKEVNGPLLQSLIESGTTPVFCALTHDGEGHLLNTNADTIANAVAISLSTHFEVTLNYCFELKGVLRDVKDPESLIPEINWELYQELKQEGVVSAGMIPKLDNAFEAIRKGVSKVNVMNIAALHQLDNEEYHEYTTLY